MTLSNIAAVRQGIANNLSAVFVNMQISPYLLSNPELPCIYVQPAEYTFDKAMDHALHEINLIARLLVAYNLDIPGQQALDLMCAPTGATSVKAAIETDMTLGGAVSYVHVTKVSAPKLLQIPGQPECLTVDFSIYGMA
jgi:hypothetical protein